MRCEHGHRWPGGVVDGARGEVNDACMFQGTECPRTCECGDVICQQGLHLLRVCCLAVPQYRKRAVGCQRRLRGAWGENTEGMNGATHSAYMTWGVWWMEQGVLSTLREGDCLAGVGEECECWCG